MASHGASATLARLEQALLARRGGDLLGAFTSHCLQHCQGFRFRLAGRRGPLHRFQWERRPAAGSLPDDLLGSLSSWRRISRATIGFAAFSLQGDRQALATLTMAVDGTLRDGSRRSDRGTLRVLLRRSMDDTWLIHGLDPVDVETLVGTRPIFVPAPRQPRLAPLPPETTPDLGAPLADRGPGLAVADVDGDGRLDLFLPGPGLGRLLLGGPGGSLRPGPALPRSSAFGETGLFGDFDRDGDPDLLVVAARGRSTLLENLGQGRFRTSSKLRLGPGSAAAWLDVNGDGRLDLLFAPRRATGRARPRLLLGRADRFVEERNALPILAQPTVAACAGDLDRDGRTDLVLVSGLGPVQILMNRRGKLRPIPSPTPLVLGRACRLADLDADGDLDVVIAAVHSPEAWKAAQPGFPLPGAPFRPPGGLRTRLRRAVQGSCWLENRGQGRFARRALATPASLGWDLDAAVTDLDADGRPEVLLCGGHHRRPGARAVDDLFFTRILPRQLVAGSWPRISPARSLGATRGAVFLWNTPQGFVDAGAPIGLRLAKAARAAVWADLDRDGTPELIVRLQGGSLKIWSTRELHPGRTLTLRLDTRGTAALGATATARALDRQVTAHLQSATSELRLGLGNAVRADQVVILWPDGRRQVIQDLETSAGYTVFQGHSEPRRGLAWAGPPPPRPARPLPRLRRPGFLAGLELAALPGLTVTTRAGARAPLKTHLGPRATVVFLPPAACPGFEQTLARMGQQLRRRGARILVLGPGRPTRSTAGLIRLGYQASVTTITASSLERLLLMDGQGRVTLAYIGKLPQLLVLKQQVERLIQKQGP